MIQKTQKGFSLLEILVVIAIIAVLASIGVPMYQNSLNKSRRADAKVALIALAQAQETYLGRNIKSYASVIGQTTSMPNNQIGCKTACVFENNAAYSPEGYYELSIDNYSGTNFEITATAIADGAQKKDRKRCNIFAINARGIKASAGTDANYNNTSINFSTSGNTPDKGECWD
jgi:type IV pilus assembly protein PilE